MLKGTLDDFTLADIFRLVSLARRTGKLEVMRSAGQGKVFVRDGEVYYAESGLGREPLGQKLIRAGVISESSLMRALDENASSGRRVGEILVDSGLISVEQLESALRAQIEDAVFDLLRWDLGEFVWEPGVVADVEVNIAVSVENLIIEASRRLDELEVISRKIPSMDTVLRMAPRPPEGAVEINITPEEWRMLVLVDGQRSVRDIAATVGLEDFSALRSLYGLVSAGLVEVPEGAEADSGPGELVAGLIGEAQRETLTAPQAQAAQETGTPEDTVDEPDVYVESAAAHAGGAVEGAADDDGEAEEDPPLEVQGEAVTEVEVDSHEPELNEEDPGTEDEASETEGGPAELEMDPGSLGGSFDPLAPLEEEATFVPDPEATAGQPEAEPEGVVREAPQDLDSVTSFDAPSSHELETESPVADPFLSDLLGEEPSDPQATEEEPTEETMDPEASPQDPASEGPVVDRTAVVRELAGLFDEERPSRSTRDRQAGEDPGAADERKRVEDDEDLNKGLIGRLIDGVKGL